MPKFGPSQWNKKPPVWWVRLEDAYTMAFAPGLMTFLFVLLDDYTETQKIVDACVVFSIAIIKTIGKLLGTDSEPMQIPHHSPEEKPIIESEDFVE